jgi:PAS domain S-box-containing protein
MRPRTIRGKLLVGLAVIQVVVTLLVLIVVPARFAADLEAGATDHAASVAAITASSVAGPLLARDSARMAGALEYARTDPGVQYVAIVDRNGRVVASAGTAPGAGQGGAAGSDEGGAARTVWVEHPIEAGVGEVGRVDLVVSLRELESVVARARIGITATQLALLVLILGAAWLVARVAVRPIESMSTTAEAIASGDTDRRMEPTGDADLDMLVTSFNRVVERLNGAREDLTESNRHLEDRVRERTEELRREVEERARAEAELAAAKRQYEALLDAVPDLAWLKDAAGRYLACNEAFVRFAGRDRAAIIGCRDDDLFPSDLAERLTGGDRRALVEGGTVRVEEKLVPPSGPARTHEIVRAPFRNSTGAWAGTAGISRDITDRLTLEDQVRSAQRLESVGRLAGGIAHDFNNFLTAIQGFGLMIQDRGQAVDVEIRESASEIIDAAGRAAALTRQLLAYSRQQVLDPEVMDVNALVLSTRKLLERLIGEHIEFDVHPGEGSMRIYADAGQIQQVLMNLVINARDAMQTGGRLLIETRQEVVDRERAETHPGFMPGRYVVIEVADTGHGMDRETLAQIFDPFFTTKEPGEGTGLGMSMVYGIVKQSGGFIWPYSEPGVGTTFRIYLPVSDREPARSPGRPTDRSRTVFGGRTVLVVEDERAVRILARKALERESFEVLEAGTGTEGLRLLAREDLTIDLLVTDMVMPGMGGKELATRALELRPGLAIVFMSGYSRDFLAQQNGMVREHTILEKPFTPTELVRCVADATTTAGQRSSRIDSPG